MTRLLAEAWAEGKSQADYTMLRVEVRGEKNGQSMRMTFELLDEYDPVLKLSSMSRTTGFTAAACVLLIQKGILTSTGVMPLELVGQNENCYSFLMNYLQERNIVIREKVEEDLNKLEWAHLKNESP